MRRAAAPRPGPVQTSPEIGTGVYPRDPDRQFFPPGPVTSNPPAA